MKLVPCTSKAPARLNGGFTKNSKFIRLILLIVTSLAMHDGAFAIPHEPTVVKELEGVVEEAVWRSGFKFMRVDLDKMHSMFRMTEREVVVEPHWIVILSDIHGIDAETVQAFSAYFLRNEPWDNIYDYKKPKDGRLLLWIPGGKDIKLKRGDRVKLSEAGLDYWEEGADISYKTILVEDGDKKTIHKFPKPKDSKKPPTIKKK